MPLVEVLPIRQLRVFGRLSGETRVTSVYGSSHARFENGGELDSTG